LELLRLVRGVVLRAGFGSGDRLGVLLAHHRHRADLLVGFLVLPAALGALDLLALGSGVALFVWVILVGALALLLRSLGLTVRLVLGALLFGLGLRLLFLRRAVVEEVFVLVVEHPDVDRRMLGERPRNLDERDSKRERDGKLRLHFMTPD